MNFNTLNARRSFARTVYLGVVVCIAGCASPEYEVASVEGVVRIKGKPGDQVRIEFIPEAEIVGPRSVAETDAQGHFTMTIVDRDGSTRSGAVVGEHRVTLSDVRLSKSATGAGIPIRFGSEYTLPSSTPLSQTVKSGEQLITIELP